MYRTAECAAVVHERNISIKTERFCLSFAPGLGWSQVGLRLRPKTCLMETQEQLLWCYKYYSNSSALS